MQLLLGLLIPFLGTTLGASMVFLMKNKMSAKTEKIFFSGIDYKFSLDRTIKIVYTEAVKTITLVRRRIYI